MTDIVKILDDEDDGLTCRLCLASYWYKAEIHEHLKTVHSISDPEKYDSEEKEKKLRRMREEQQRILLAKKQREERERRLREAKYGRGRGGPGTIKLTSPGARPSQSPGQRPSFQYRDGAFICDLCKESFSDGNDMVTHWKSHVKKQQADAAKVSRGRPRGRGRGRPRGRPSLEDGEEDSSDDDDDDDDDGVRVDDKIVMDFSPFSGFNLCTSSLQFAKWTLIIFVIPGGPFDIVTINLTIPTFTY